MTTYIAIHRTEDRNRHFEPSGNYLRKVVYVADVNIAKGAEGAEELFHITNAPEEMLNERQLPIARDIYSKRIYSISVSDVVQIDNEYFLCNSVGWTKLKGLSL